MSLHPECPYRPNDPYHLNKGPDRRITPPEGGTIEDIELQTKNPETEIVTLAAQELLNKPEDIDAILQSLREVFQSRLGNKARIKGYDYETSLKKAERSAVWAPYWHHVAVIMAEKTLPALQGERPLVQGFPADGYPWEEADNNDEFLTPLELDDTDRLYMHTLRSLLFDADTELVERIHTTDEYSALQSLLPHLDRTYAALTGGGTAADGLSATYVGSGGSVALREFRAVRASPNINEDPFTHIPFTRLRAQLLRSPSFQIVPLQIQDIDGNTLILGDKGVPQHKPHHYRSLESGHRGRCIAQFPLVSPSEQDRQLLDRFYSAAISLGAKGEGITKDRIAGSGELTTIFAIADAQARKELM